MDTLYLSTSGGRPLMRENGGSRAATQANAATSTAEAGAGSIRFESVRKSFGNYVAVDGIDIHIRENEFFTLLGPSGCGKTTLLRMLAGFEAPSAGRILLDDNDIAHLPPNQRPINTVFQNYALFPHMTVAENVGFGLRMLKRPRAEIAAIAEDMLRLVRLEDKSGRLVTQLSGGQQQRVALARALAAKPRVLLLDEPLSALDLKLRKSMQIELKRLQEKAGITFIFVTHDQEEALTMSDRIAVMDSGKVQQIGTAREIYDHPANRFVAGFIGETNFLRGELLDRSAGSVRLECGPTIAAALPDGLMRGEVTLAVRPEHIEIVAQDASEAVAARVEHLVYFGTDTHILAVLPDGTELTIRRQNLRSGRAEIRVGDTIGVAIPANAAQVLKD